MLRKSTIDKWKPLIDGYDRSKESVSSYCLRNGVETKKYYHYRKLLSEIDNTPVSLLPVVVTNHSEEQTISIRINGVAVSYLPANISDKELSRILRLCRDL